MSSKTVLPSKESTRPDGGKCVWPLISSQLSVEAWVTTGKVNTVEMQGLHWCVTGHSIPAPSAFVMQPRLHDRVYLSPGKCITRQQVWLNSTFLPGGMCFHLLLSAPLLSACSHLVPCSQVGDEHTVRVHRRSAHPPPPQRPSYQFLRSRCLLFLNKVLCLSAQPFSRLGTA